MTNWGKRIVEECREGVVRRFFFFFWKWMGSSIKGARWMPRHRTAMKDVASCEKPRGAASER